MRFLYICFTYSRDFQEKRGKNRYKDYILCLCNFATLNECPYHPSRPPYLRALLRRDADETLLNDDYEPPGDVIGNSVQEDKRDEDVVEWIVEMLARAPADRVWRRRGWLAMLNARRRRSMVDAATTAAAKQLQSLSKSPSAGPPKPDDGQLLLRGADAGEEGVTPPRVSRMRMAGVEWGGEVGHVVHPSLMKFHSTVAKLVDVTDELVFRRIVSFL